MLTMGKEPTLLRSIAFFDNNSWPQMHSLSIIPFIILIMMTRPFCESKKQTPLHASYVCIIRLRPFVYVAYNINDKDWLYLDIFIDL